MLQIELKQSIDGKLIENSFDRLIISGIIKQSFQTLSGANFSNRRICFYHVEKKKKKKESMIKMMNTGGRVELCQTTVS